MTYSRFDGAISLENENQMAARRSKAQKAADEEAAEEARWEKHDAEVKEALKTFNAEQIPQEARPVRPMGTTMTHLVLDANLIEFNKQTKDKLTLSMNLGQDKPFSDELYQELIKILGEHFTDIALKKIEKLQVLKLLTDAVL